MKLLDGLFKRKQKKKNAQRSLDLPDTCRNKNYLAEAEDRILEIQSYVAKKEFPTKRTYEIWSEDFSDLSKMFGPSGERCQCGCVEVWSAIQHRTGCALNDVDVYNP